MKIKTSELTDAALDWAVAQIEPGFNYKLLKHVKWPDDEYWVQYPNGVIYHCVDDTGSSMNRHYHKEPWSPSTDWSQGGPIIDREDMVVGPSADDTIPQCAWMRYDDQKYWAAGPTKLIAAMRCFVTSRLGNEVDVPKELLK